MKAGTARPGRRIGFPITRRQPSPGTGAWNEITHRLFSFLIQNRRGKPPASDQAILPLIAATAARSGTIWPRSIVPRADSPQSGPTPPHRSRPESRSWLPTGPWSRPANRSHSKVPHPK
ncbi:MAG: hypothetical protein KGL52_00895, partial [Rhodospirillales bacterium]|nr:hypothetical protein [Rhodospirillales bacterium]